MLGTQAIATLIAVYGLFMTPLGWGWAAFVWAYALAWFLVNDRIKLAAYRILDSTKKRATISTNPSVGDSRTARGPASTTPRGATPESMHTHRLRRP